MVALDRYKDYGVGGLTSPFTSGQAIVPHDSEELIYVTRAL